MADDELRDEFGDDELLDLLGDALAVEPSEPDPARVAAVRDAAAARQAASGAADSARVTALDARRPKRPGRWLLAAAAAAVAVVGAVVIVGSRDNGVDGDVEYAGPIDGEAGVGEIVVTKTGIGRVIELDTDDLPILPTGELYEIWFVGPGDAPGSPNRISAGTFHPDAEGTSQVTFAAAVDPALYPRVEITSELGDGDPSPSDIVVLEVDLGTG